MSNMDLVRTDFTVDNAIIAISNLYFITVAIVFTIIILIQGCQKIFCKFENANILFLL